MVKLNILSDWNQQLDAYNAPKVLIKKLMNKHKNLSFDFDDNKKKDLINIYIGNLPFEKKTL